MGWSGISRASDGNAERAIKGYIESGGNSRVLDCEMVRDRPGSGDGVFYAAVEILRGGSAGEVRGFAGGFGRSHDGWLTLQTGEFEEVGPAAFGCPGRIIDLLTPTSNPRASAWRDACRASAEAVAGRAPGI